MESAVYGHDASVTALAARMPDPYAVFVSTVVSLRTRDSVTADVSDRVLEAYPDIFKLSGADPEILAKLLHPAAFYRNKAKSLIRAAIRVISEHKGRIPSDIESLLRLPGVGRKTAQLVRAEGFGLPAVCVDIHVHRISNRLGLCETRTPDETELALTELFEKQDWNRINRIMVPFGQKICLPVSPRCTRCPLQTSCPRYGVKRSR